MKLFVATRRAARILAIVAMLPAVAGAQGYPSKPITMYVAYGAGATTDITARALAKAAEAVLGVPIAIENKGGGGGTLAAGLLASKKPDGYTLLVGSTGPLTIRPLLLKVSYNPANITGIIEYSHFHNGSVVVNANSPWKTIDEFIAYAKQHPGMSYATAGAGGVPTGSQQQGVVALMQCKGLQFKHVPTKGGTEANTMLMGNHVDFTSGSGSHNPLVVEGVFRQLVVFEKTRDPNFPDTPTLKDIGCDWDNPPDSGMAIFAPKGLPPDVSRKLEQTFTAIVKSDDFQAMLKRNYLPFDFKDSKQLAADIKGELDWFTAYFRKTGDLKN